MKINGRRTHLGERSRSGGQTRAIVALVQRPSPEPDLVVTWYPHRDALSLLPPDSGRHEDHLRTRGRFTYWGQPSRMWSSG